MFNKDQLDLIIDLCEFAGSMLYMDGECDEDVLALRSTAYTAKEATDGN